MQMEVDMAGGGMGAHPEQMIGEPSNFGCPDCGGPLRTLQDGKAGTRFRCHVGHGWSATSLADVQRTKIEEAIWTAIRWLDEEEMLSTYGAERARRKGKARLSKIFEDRAEQARSRGNQLRALLRDGDPLPDEDLVAAEGKRSVGS
jgi:two-component system, chemotaxis family, protein-glutamate methylesterase/glutaminase